MSKIQLKLITFVLIFFFIFSQIPNSSSLNTGPFIYDTGLANIPYNIEVKFWGFDELLSNIGADLSQRLPQEIYHESYNPSEGVSNNHFIQVGETFWGLKSKLNYQLTKMDELDNSTGFLADNMQILRTVTGNPITSQRYFDENSNPVTLNGLPIHLNEFTDLLADYNNEKGYTIHLVNMTLIDNPSFNSNGNHWYYAGTVNNLPRNDDMRNLGYVGDKGVFYDPTAMAPVFENNSFESIVNNQTAVLDYLYERLIKIIENIIVGSPYSFNYISMEEKIEIAQVVVGDSSTTNDGQDYDFVKAKLKQFFPIDGLSAAIPDLLPYLNISYNQFEVDLKDSKNVRMKNFLNNNVNETGFINLGSSQTEVMKNFVRSIYYNKFPTRFFYVIFIFVDSKTTEFIFDDKTGSQPTYENKDIGVGILNLKDWRLLNSTDRTNFDILKNVYRVFGKLFGMTELTDPFSSQVLSRMSSYGITKTRSPLYSPIEVQNLAKRYAAPFNITTKESIKSYRKDLEGSVFKWIDTSPLDDAEKLRIEGDIAYRLENYTKAAEIYIDAFQKWTDAKEEIDQTIIAIYNSVNFVGGVIIVTYVIIFIRSLTLSKEEFEKRYDSTVSK